MTRISKTRTRHPAGRLTIAAAIGLVALLAAPLRPLAVPMSMEMEVSTMGMVVGTLKVSGYDAGKNAAGDGVKATISADFVKKKADGTAIDAAANQKLVDWFPQGLTYIQAHSFMFDSNKQQQIFRDKDGNDLKGWFPDPPAGGYTLPDGTTQFSTDKRPWYSNIDPTMVAGDVPPTLNWAGGTVTAQLYDGPMIPFADIPDGMGGFVDGLLDLLDGKNGMWVFETALVGVKEKPSDADALTGEYRVVALKTFSWGFDFKFTGNAADGITAADYTVTKKALTFGTEASKELQGAFDREGDNSDVEWEVNFVSHVPEPGTAAVLAVGLLVICWRRRSRMR